MTKTNPYPDLKASIEGRAIMSFKYVTLVVPVTRLARDMKMNYATLRYRLAEPSTITMGEIARLAVLIKMDKQKLFKWIIETSMGNGYK